MSIVASKAFRQSKAKQNFQRFQRHVRPQRVPPVMVLAVPDPGALTMQQARDVAGACFVRLLLACFSDYCRVFAQLLTMEGGER